MGFVGRLYVPMSVLVLMGLLLAFSAESFARIIPASDLYILGQESIQAKVLQHTRRGHRALGYGRARIELLGKLALEERGGEFAIHDVYCDADYTSSDFPSGEGPGPGVVPAHTILNTEHTWPQSQFGGKEKEVQKCDLHHLFPSDTQMNSTRSSYPFGEVVTDFQKVKCQASKMGRNKSGQWVFEPPAGHKGEVARALFYFSVRYGLPIDDDEESVLRRWHDADPVSAEEITRNQEILKIQGNSNPFIDQPELVRAFQNF